MMALALRQVRWRAPLYEEQCTLPSEEGGPGKKGKSPPVAVRLNPSLFEPRRMEHTLLHGEELARFIQALLPLSSGLTPPHGG